MSENLTRLTITGIALDTHQDVPVVILEDSCGIRVLPVSVGPFEANAIIVILKGIRMPRMLTHELFAHFMAENKFTLTKLVITGKLGNDYKAKLFYKRGRRTRLLEIRPSDGIALSLQFHNPIYAPEHLLVPKSSVLSRFISQNTVSEDPIFIEKETRERTLM